MTGKTKTILLIVGLLAVIILAVISYGAYRLYSIFSYFGNREVPAELTQARVTKGADLLRRSEFYKLRQGGIVKGIRDGLSESNDKEREKRVTSSVARGIYNFSDLRRVGDEVVAVGQFGGFVFDLNGTLKKEILFDPLEEKVKVGPYEQTSYRSETGDIRIVRLAPGRIGFLSFGSIQGVTVFDENGQHLWNHGRQEVDLGSVAWESDAEYEKSTHVLGAAVGDLDGDGVSEYIVARKKDGLRAYDQLGQEKWFQADDFASSELRVVDINGDGKGELIEIGTRIRSGIDGSVIRETKGSDAEALLIVDRTKQEKELQFARFNDDKLIYRDEKGAKLFEADAPLARVMKSPETVPASGDPEISLIDDDETVAFPKGAWVTLRRGEPKYLAIVAGYIGLPRSNLYIYDRNGTLVYHELLDEAAEVLEIVPGNGDAEDILVGGKDTIWRYSAN